METQDYKAKPKIEGVILQDLKTHYMDDGYFTEIARLTDTPEVQFNHSVLFPGAIKAFHIHKSQNDYWYCFRPLLVSLYDLREDGPTLGTNMRFMLCNQLLKIPIGVLHGVSNVMKSDVDLFYVVDKFFNPENPDEGRIDPFLLGDKHWHMSIG